MNELWNLMLSWVKVFANWYWGGGDGLLASLAVFVVMAHVTDGMCAIVDHRPLNRAWAPAMFKSILIFILVHKSSLRVLIACQCAGKYTSPAHNHYFLLSFC